MRMTILAPLVSPDNRARMSSTSLVMTDADA